MADNYLYSEVTERIIRAFYTVYNILGSGFLEKVYQNALLIELGKLGLNCHAYYPVDVYYYNDKVGFYIADIVVNNCIVIEVKAAENICKEHEAQVTNYLKATQFEVGMLLNFGKEPQFKRKVLSSPYKLLKNHNNHKDQRPPSCPK